VVIVV